MLDRISAIAPPEKRTKNDVFGSANVENTRENGPGFELAARHQHTHERVGRYPNSNRRRIVSDLSLFRYVMRLLADISADSTNPVNVPSNSLLTLGIHEFRFRDDVVVIYR